MQSSHTNLATIPKIKQSNELLINTVAKFNAFYSPLQQVNGDGLSLALSADLDSFKAEIIREMRLEIQKAKQEIIDGKPR